MDETGELPQGKSKCAIRRVGRLVILEEDFAVMDVEGKQVRMPIAKLSPGVIAGDVVKWDGDRWVREAMTER